MNNFANLFIAAIVVVLILGGPFTLFAIIKIASAVMGKIKPRVVRMPGASVGATDDATLGLLVDWDNASFPEEVCRVRVDFSELVRGGRSSSFSFTFEDKSAKKRGFLIPMKLKPEDFAMLTDNGVKGSRNAVDHSYIMVEVETVKGDTFRRKIWKKSILAALNGAAIVDKEIEVLQPMQPDSWALLTRVFPWRKVVASAEVATEAKAAAPKKSKGPAAPTLVDFIVTKVWIEPGCIVCDACENEAPDVFQVLPDTCIVRENAPLSDGAAIKAAAEGCPVNVIKFNTVPKAQTA